MANCPSCSKPVKEHWNYCASCGASLSSETHPTRRTSSSLVNDFFKAETYNFKVSAFTMPVMLIFGGSLLWIENATPPVVLLLLFLLAIVLGYAIYHFLTDTIWR